MFSCLQAKQSNTFYIYLLSKHEREFQVVEFYAGVGRVASLAKWVGYKTAAIDVLYGENRAKPGGRKPMDINGSAGFVSLDLSCFFQGGFYEHVQPTTGIHYLLIHKPLSKRPVNMRLT